MGEKARRQELIARLIEENDEVRSKIFVIATRVLDEEYFSQNEQLTDMILIGELANRIKLAQKLISSLQCPLRGE